MRELILLRHAHAEPASPGQADLDRDGKGDACDLDVDGDGHSNAKERAHGTDPADPTSYPGRKQARAGL